MAYTLPSNEEKYEYVHAQFERIAKRYDLTNDVINFGMHRLWKARAVDLLVNNNPNSTPIDSTDPENSPERPRHFLDVCTGTGDLALTIANRLKKGDKVTGLDFSAGMLSVAKTRAGDFQNQSTKSGCDLEWIEGDAQNLPFDDNSFDGAIISFGLRNLTNINLGLSEMRRVVKPGGLVINLDLGRPEGIIFAPAFKFFFGSVVPVIGSILQNDRNAYTYLPESMSTYPDPEQISERFEIVGLEKVKHTALAGGSVALHHGTV